MALKLVTTTGRRWPLLAAVFVASTLTACGSKGSTATTTASTRPTTSSSPSVATSPTTTSPAFPIKIIGYDYRETDVGDGYKVGTIRLAFLNPTDRAILVDPFDIKGGTAMTAEGQGYPAGMIGADQLEHGCCGDPIEKVVKDGKLDLTSAQKVILTALDRALRLPLPPRVPAVRTGGDAFGGDAFAGYRSALAVAFRAASASHPNRLELTVVGRGPVSIDLTTAPKTLPRPTAAELGAANLTQFAADFSKTTTGWTLQFESRCIQNSTGGATIVGIPFTLKNLDQLNPAKVRIDFPYARYDPAGILYFEPKEAITKEVGPGQTVTDQQYFAGGSGSYLFTYKGTELGRSYVLDCK